MKKAEAISILATSVRPREAKDRARYDKAVKMAIEALNCSEFPNNSDTISRQAAIDALHMHLMYRMGTDSNKKRLDEWINNLPSAQPDCTDCIKNGGDWNCDHVHCHKGISIQPELYCAQQPDLSDDGTLMMTVPNGMLNDVKRVMVNEVSTKFCKVMYQDEPERKKGRWNMIQGNIVVCSECGMGAPQVMTGCLMNRYLEPNMTNFCPNCGADMRGTEND